MIDHRISPLTIKYQYPHPLLLIITCAPKALPRTFLNSASFLRSLVTERTACPLPLSHAFSCNTPLVGFFKRSELFTVNGCQFVARMHAHTQRQCPPTSFHLSKAPPAPLALSHHKKTQKTTPPTPAGGATLNGPHHQHSRDEPKKTDYERFNSNNVNIHSWSWNYRGCWHQAFPPLAPRRTVYLALIPIRRGLCPPPLLFLVTTSRNSHWVIFAPAASLGSSSRFSGSFSGIEPRFPVPVVASGVQYTPDQLIGGHVESAGRALSLDALPLLFLSHFPVFFHGSSPLLL